MSCGPYRCSHLEKDNGIEIPRATELLTRKKRLMKIILKISLDIAANAVHLF